MGVGDWAGQSWPSLPVYQFVVSKQSLSISLGSVRSHILTILLNFFRVK